MEIADIDGSGTIDLEEFTDFITKLENAGSIDAQKIFEEQDKDGSGELDVPAFGQALFAALKDMKVEEGNESDN